MADVAPSPRAGAARIAVVIVILAIMLNGAFFFLSSLYAGDRPGEVDLGNVRRAFAVLSVVVGIASLLAAMSPRAVGHVLAVLLGIGALVGGVGAISRDMPGVMGAVLLILGGILPVLAYFSWAKHSRAAWSYIIALLSVFATVTLFGAPKLRGILDISLWTALIIPGVKIVATFALATVRGEYRDKTA